MAQEFTIKAPTIEDKINQLLPSQGGFGAGVDFSASTMVVPIVDLTETAEGSTLRQDLQSALSHDSVTAHFVSNATVVLQNTPGYWRIFGTSRFDGSGQLIYQLNDGATTKTIRADTSAGAVTPVPVDFIVYLNAGDSVQIQASNANVAFTGCSRQLADNSQNLVNP